MKFFVPCSVFLRRTKHSIRIALPLLFGMVFTVINLYWLEIPTIIRADLNDEFIGLGDSDRSLSVSWGDVDGDGDLDLAVGNLSSTNKVFLNESGMLNTANPFWESEDNLATWKMAWGDVDGDGDLDLAVGNGGWPVAQPNKIYLNVNGTLTTTGAPQFSDASILRRTYSLAWGDVDGDGDLDLVAGNAGANRLYLNLGAVMQAANWNPSTIDNWTVDVAWGDVDKDGDLDLALGSQALPNKVGSIGDSRRC